MKLEYSTVNPLKSMKTYNLHNFRINKIPRLLTSLSYGLTYMWTFICKYIHMHTYKTYITWYTRMYACMCSFNSLRPRQMDAISQTTFSNAFSWMKMFEFRLKLFPRVQLTIFHHWFRSWLGAVQATSHYLNQWWLVYRRIFASLGLNELKCDMM